MREKNYNISQLLHYTTQEITDITADLGKVWLPSNSLGLHPWLLLGQPDFPTVYNFGYCPRWVQKLIHTRWGGEWTVLSGEDIWARVTNSSTTWKGRRKKHCLQLPTKHTVQTTQCNKTAAEEDTQGWNIFFLIFCKNWTWSSKVNNNVYLC